MTRKTIPTLEEIGLLRLGEQGERIATDLIETGIQINRHMEEAMRYARPIELDGGVSRHLQEQIALTGNGLTDSALSALDRDTDDIASRVGQVGLTQDSHARAYEAVIQQADSMCDRVTKVHEDVVRQARVVRESLTIEPPVDIARMIQDLLPQKPLHTMIGDMASQALGAAHSANTVTGLSDLLREQQKRFESLFEQIERSPLDNWRQVMTDTFHSVRQDLDDLGDTQVTLGERGELVVEGRELEEDEVHDALAELGLGGVGRQENRLVFAEKELQEIVQSAVRKGLNKPRHKIALLILLQLILNILGSLAAASLMTTLQDPSTKNQAGNVRAIQKRISRSAKQLDVNPRVLRTLRIVLRSELPVFNRMRQRSGKADVLYLGEVVTLLERRRNWALIEHGSGDDLVRGWVFARYLGKITFEPVLDSTEGLPREFACD